MRNLALNEMEVVAGGFLQVNDPNTLPGSGSSGGFNTSSSSTPAIPKTTSKKGSIEGKLGDLSFTFKCCPVAPGVDISLFEVKITPPKGENPFLNTSLSMPYNRL